MRRVVWTGLVTGALAMVLLAPAGAQAGTYDVVSCNAPGANGRNNSLEFVTASYDPQYNGSLPAWYEGDGSCADGLVARSSGINDGRQAKWLTTAYWRFVAPPGTEIVEMTSWRYGEAHDQPGDDANTSFIDEGDHWRVEVVDSSNQPIGGLGGGETCSHGLNVPSCAIGSSGGTAQTNRVATDQLRWQIGCGGEIVGGCQTAGPGPLATMIVYGTRIRLQDSSAPAASIGGPLTTPGWHKPSDPVIYNANDNSGIRSATLSAGPLTATDRRVCDFTLRVPCSNASRRPFSWPGTLPDGQYPIRLTVRDAAQNGRVVTATVAVDGTPPSVDLRRPRGRTLRLRVADAASGFAAGAISVRNSPAEPFRPLPTELHGRTLRARLDAGNPRRVDLAATVRDAAGNEVSGQPTRIRVTSVTSQRLRANVRKGGRVRVKYGRPLTIRGQVALATGTGVSGIPVSVTSTPRAEGSVPYVEAAGTPTAANGRFVITLPKGPARTSKINFAGGAGALASVRTLKLQVPASSTIRASRTRIGGAGRVRFRGRVRGGAGANLVVVLQGLERGRWRTFADTRTDRAGRWRASYRFSGLPGDFPVRVRIPRQANLPYTTGFSKRVTVHVR